MTAPPPPPPPPHGRKAPPPKRVEKAPRRPVRRPGDPATVWDGIVGVSRPDEGTTALVVEFEGGRRVVLKGSQNVATEAYATVAARLCGLRAPGLQLVLWPGTEWYLMKARVRDMVESESALARHTEQVLRRTVLFVQDFVDGAVPMHDCEGFAVGEELLDDLGRMVMFDVYMNNHDRVPCGTVWDNCGNFGNALVTTRDGRLHPIDNQFAAVADPAAHAAKIRAVLGDVDGHAKAVWQAVACGYQDRLAAGVADPAAHIAAGMRSMAETLRAKAPYLPALCTRLRTCITTDWEDVWRMQTDSLKAAFIAACSAALFPDGAAPPPLPDVPQSFWDPLLRISADKDTNVAPQPSP
eukprot:TRINITY_DN331_c0_g2_i1.p1 TRINITY_DN331_c0_g2~~TRINITY_DN331_c0_g2_i1.p1  ORF type:complete len:363 (+),score=108.65 TRINITY_DN331_c0_g2_i1:29-1090(+)